MSRHLLRSLFMMLAMASCQAAMAALISVDLDERSTPSAGPTLSGFSSFKMAGTTAASSSLESQVVAGYTVTLQAFDDGLDENTVTAGVQNLVGQIDDRLRTTPTNSGAFTYAALYSDVIFAGGTTGTTGGMDLTVSGGSLLPNTQYAVSLYAFDSGSTPAPQPRTAAWLDGNNANALVVNTSFNAATLPTANDQYKFVGLAVTDATGKLFLKGRNTTANAATGGVSIGVLLNGFEVSVVPEPTSMGLSLVGFVYLALRTRRKR